MRSCLVALFCLFVLPAWSADYRVGERLPAGKGGAGAYREIRWNDLVPKDWDPMAAFRGIDLNKMSDSDPRAMEALAKARAEWDKAPVEPKMNGQRIRLPGFVLPLERQGELVRELLLVPYFGACIHSPPPPANQVVHVVLRQPVKGMRTMDAYWISGTLSVQGGDSGLGTYAYRLAAERAEIYQPPSKDNKK